MDEIMSRQRPATQPSALAETLRQEQSAVQAPQEAAGAPVGRDQLQEWNKTLRDYKAAKSDLDRRVQAAEDWWRLRNTRQEMKNGDTGGDPVQFHSVSGWLHNVIVSKHADAMDSYPSPSILPREMGDRAEAEMLSSIIPAVLEQNRFESVYSDATWQKLKTGTGCYKVMWDAKKLRGLGDINIQRVNILNLYWTPNIYNLQDSRMVFHVEPVDVELLEAAYPQVRGKIKGADFVQARMPDEHKGDDAKKANVVEVYYKKFDGMKDVLHYCKYVGDEVLYATENDPQARERGLYDHGRFPFVFDRLYPVEGSPCGYGFVDLCRNPQTEIDLLKTAFVKNSLAGATPRYFVREDGEVSVQDLLNLNNPVIKVSGNLGQDSIRVLDHNGLDGNYENFLQMTIQELRETSGNTETATGSSHGGATAASAIAALQEAAGKGSRDATQASYRCFSEIVDMVIELIRQFYDMPRQFRILGEYGTQKFVSYSNAGLKPQSLDPGGYRLPVFDIKVEPQRKSAYSQVTQNELALQFYHEGFFNPQMTDQALACLDMMDFDGKDDVVQKIAQNGTLAQKLIQWQQMALQLAARISPELVQGLAMQIQQDQGGAPMAAPAGGIADINLEEPLGEASNVRRARAMSQAASRPRGEA